MGLFKKKEITAVDFSKYVHESDAKAMEALKAIPGFTALCKGFMKIWSEKQYLIQNMSTNLKVSEEQLPKYYDMLQPICEKLGIERPELYIKLDVEPNAYTFGETNPFIVITSGLIESFPDELIRVVLAHECGHIACHHSLYTTMGNIILDGAALGLGGLISLPLQVAFYYWMRCSELSADRAAAVYTGGSDKIVDMCMRFAGYTKDVNGKANKEAFFQQAIEYKKLTDESKWNKTLEFIALANSSHPFNSVRAYEIDKWCKTEEFQDMLDN